jgi:hypothetical protein
MLGSVELDPSLAETIAEPQASAVSQLSSERHRGRSPVFARDALLGGRYPPGPLAVDGGGLRRHLLVPDFRDLALRTDEGDVLRQRA